MEYQGYLRPDGQVGIRNWVGIISAQDNVNPVTRAITSLVSGTVPITTLFVRGQYGYDLETAFDTLAGMGRNPNLAAVLVVGLEPDVTETIAERIRPCGKPVETIWVQEAGGTIEATLIGTRIARNLVIEASYHKREPSSFDSLTVGLECGGSDTTSGLSSNPAVGFVADRVVSLGGQAIISETSEFIGAEHIFARRAQDARVGEVFLSRISDWESAAMTRGVDIRGAQPIADNIKGGLTTIEEKSLGAMAKAGTSPLMSVVEYSVRPKGPGLHFMATPAPAVESMTGLAAAGCQMILFSTGVGNPSGNMISPTVKITGNRQTASSFADNIDYCVSEILDENVSISKSGENLFAFVSGIASGVLTASEVLNQRETAISRFESSI